MKQGEADKIFLLLSETEKSMSRRITKQERRCGIRPRFAIPREQIVGAVGVLL